MNELKFLIVSSGYNCEALARECIDSVKKQTYENFTAIFADDGSQDGTMGAIESEIDGWLNMKAKRTEYNRGAAFHRYMMINESGVGEEAVILFLGLDDELKLDALETIKKEYDEGKWVTYGNWVNQYGKTLPEGYLTFPDEVHADRSYRKVKYRSTAPNTFKRFLFNRIPKEDFMIDGKWIDTTTESEVMFSCLEMSGKEKIGVIEKPIYLYNEGLDGGSLNRLGREYKYEVYNKIIARPKRELLLR